MKPKQSTISVKVPQPKHERPRKKEPDLLEEYNGRAIENIVLENQQLKNTREKMAGTIKRLNDEKIEVIRILREQLEKQLLMNEEIAEPILREFYVHPKDSSFQDNLDNLIMITKALRWIYTCYQPNHEELTEKAKRYKSQLETLKEEYQKMSKQAPKREIGAKSVRIVANKKMLDALSAEEKKNIFMTQFSKEELKELFYELMQKKKEQRQQQQEEHVQKKIEDPQAKYLLLLEQKGYKTAPSEKKRYDTYVYAKGKKVPLCYIDYEIEDSTDFDSIMEETNDIFLLFDSKKNLNKGNTNFTSWLLKANGRRNEVAFSFTTLDKLKVSGLDELDTL